MNKWTSTYIKLVEQEQSYYQQIMTTELCLNAIFDHITQYEQSFHPAATKDILDMIQQIGNNLRADRLEVKLEKAILIYEMNKAHK